MDMQALKLAERTIQFADTLTLLTEGYLRAGRVLHTEGSLSEATRHFTAAAVGQPKHILSAIGLAQAQMQNGATFVIFTLFVLTYMLLVDEMAAAIHTLDTLLQPPNPQRSSEATVMLASLRAHPRPGVSSSDAAQERIKARELFDRALKTLEIDDTRTNEHTHTNGLSRAARRISEDIDMHAEIGRLWQDESLDRMGRALREALRISEASGQVDPRLLNNLGALYHLEGDLGGARGMYESALTRAAGLGPEIGEGMSTSMLYNLARVYEDAGDEMMAKEAYDKLLSRHPEYVDGGLPC